MQQFSLEYFISSICLVNSDISIDDWHCLKIGVIFVAGPLELPERGGRRAGSTGAAAGAHLRRAVRAARAAAHAAHQARRHQGVVRLSTSLSTESFTRRFYYDSTLLECSTAYRRWSGRCGSRIVGVVRL